MIIPPAIDIVNGTHIVPLYFPTQFAPDQLDRLGWTAIVTLTWPNILGVIALIFGTRDWYRVSFASASAIAHALTLHSTKYSYTPLAITWFLSVALVAVGIFTRYGVYDHFLHYLAVSPTLNPSSAPHSVSLLQIAHIQWEWFIITFLLGYPFEQGYINATIVGLICFITDLGLPGIRGTFFVASILGGYVFLFPFRPIQPTQIQSQLG